MSGPKTAVGSSGGDLRHGHHDTSQVGSRRRSAAILLSSGAIGSLGGLPIFLLGALAAFLRSELGIDPARLGATAAVGLAAIGVGALLGGRIADAFGPRTTMFGVVPVLGAASIGIGVLAHSWWQVAALLAVAGFAHGVGSPAEHLALLRGLPPRWHGFAFGLRGAVGPTSTLIAGLTVPLVALTVGWRWAFILCGTCVLLAGTAVRWFPGHVERPASVVGSPGRAALALGALAVAGGCGSAAGIALGTFLVDSLQASGVSVAVAGLLLSAGSVAGVVSRLGMGAAADRYGLGLRTVALMLGLGAVGHIVLAVGAPLPVMTLAAMLAFAAGWGWTGLLALSVMRSWPHAAGWANGVLTAGLAVGGAVGPALFGQMVVRTSYSTAWAVNAGVVVLAAALTLVADVMRTAAHPTNVN